MRRRWLVVAVAQQAAPLNPLRRLLRRPPPVSDARYEASRAVWNQIPGVPRHRRDVVPVIAPMAW